MPSLLQRLEALERKVSDPTLDDLSKVRDGIVDLREGLFALYKLIEENIGVRDIGLERQLKEGLTSDPHTSDENRLQ
jgi:hypothetical protein